MLTLKKLRLFHLLLAAAAAGAYFTGEMGGGGHKLVGYTVATLLVLRLALSLIPAGVFGWKRWLPSTKAPPSLRGLKHPAISRILVLAILVSTAGATTTGLLMDQGRALANPDFSFSGEHGDGEGDNDDNAYQGRQPLPMQRMVSEESEKSEGGGEGHEEEGPLSEIHELFANLLLPLVGLHIAYLLLFRLQLAQFMLFWPARKPLA